MGEVNLSESEPFKREQLRLLPQEQKHVCKKVSSDDEFCGYCGKRLQVPHNVAVASYSFAAALIILGGLYLLYKFTVFWIFAPASATIPISIELIASGGYMPPAFLLFLIVSGILRAIYRAPIRGIKSFGETMVLTAGGVTLLSWAIFGMLLGAAIIFGGAFGGNGP